ncbi:FAD/NAD(P)-binding protein [Apilactobacillus timberlakei]|uniref:Oxidoreductase n=1 Tax=Apilactobacillus timberlakei TaxID=2008380 RepID=A0ABY2YW90_9LACO|nr:FAD/NAD(P)-binding protein [Apilactobacillus timberlakei]TPR14698.1 oxidoreductase [Apilactobacillus timberlakei]TPR15665.1 oxidoreductase [Apilactobacillus timberlakei]TPR16026.1 oxidoreductase [Apilactobacillus timberlakei]
MDIAIIGAGPRGLLLLNNLIQNNNQQLNIHLFDRKNIGGRVWKINQPIDLIMNTPANELTLFNDDQNNSYSIADWIKSDKSSKFIQSLDENKYPNKKELLNAINNLQENSYVPRAICGVYCTWFFELLKNKISKDNNINLSLHLNQTVNDIQKDSKQFIVKSQKDYTVDKVVFSLGQQENQLSNTEKSFKKYASENNLTYILPEYADEVDLSSINNQSTVIIRGLGLSFNDYVSRLTKERGGKFIKDENGKLSYHRSGNEPKIFAGSRRGIPYYPKAISQKQFDENYPAYFLTKDNINKYLKDGKLPFEDFQKLLRLDVEYHYYTFLIQKDYPKINLESFQNEFLNSDNPIEVVKKSGLSSEAMFNWNLILNPAAGIKITNMEDYQEHVKTWLSTVINDARLGSKTGPIIGALEMLRDLRNNIRYVLANNLLSNEDYVSKYKGQFSSNIKFLSMGAPVIRSEELLALINAGIVEILPPQMQVIGANHKFITRSAFYGHQIIQGDALIEARTNAPNLNITDNPLLNNLKKNNIIKPQVIKLADDDVNNSSIDINVENDQVKGEPNMFTWGLNTEGLYFVTSAIPRPGVKDDILTAADNISKNILNIPVKNPTKYM